MLVKPRSLAPAVPTTESFHLAPYFALLKLRIVALLVFVSLVGAVVAGHGTVHPITLALLTLTGALSSAGAAALNHYCERDIDAAMARTCRRPLPAAQVAPRAALLLGLGLIALAMPPALALGPASAFFVLAGAFFYVFVYTLWLKRSSAWNVPIGGIAGSCAVLTGWCAAGGSPFAPVPLLMAAVIFFWNQSHFWAFAIARNEDYRAAQVPMLPVLVGPRAASWAIMANTIVMVLTSLVIYVAAPLGDLYLIGAVLAGVLFLRHNVRLVASPSTQNGWRTFKFSGIYLLVLFLAMALDTVLR